MNYFFSLLIFFYIVFPFYLKGIGLLMNAVALCFVLYSFIVNFKYISSTFKRDRKLLFSLYIYLCVTIASLYIPIIAGSYDFTYFKFLFNIAFYGIKYLSAIAFIRKYINLDLNDYLLLYIRTICIYVFITLIFLVFPSLRDFWDEIIIVSELNQELGESLTYISRYGIQGYSGFMHTYMCNIATVFCVYLYITKPSKINSNELVSYILLLTIGNMCYGRVGLIANIMLICYLLLYNVIVKRLYKFFFISLISLSFISFLIYLLLQDNELAMYWFNWAFEPFINYVEYGEFSSSSSDHLQTMYFIPDIYTILFGDGKYTASSGGYYMDTDVGFLRPILFYGIVNTLLSYFVLIIILIHLRKLIQKGIIFTGLLFFLFLMYEIKGEAFHYMIMALLPACFIININRNEKKMFCNTSV